MKYQWTTQMECEYLQLLEEEAQDKARNHLLNFALYTMKDFRTNWHHKIICDKLTDFANGKIKRLMIFAPPRHTKSELSSRKLPAFIIGKDPSAKIIISSYSASLSGAMNQDAQRLMDTPEYRTLFPNVTMNEENSRKYGNFTRHSKHVEFIKAREDKFIATGGSIRATGTNGTLTGLGANYIIIDDIVKNQQEADSPVYRERAYKFYTSTLASRQQKDCGILLLNTRWHDVDLAGRLLKDAENDPEADQWEVITLPAIAEKTPYGPYDKRKEGEALWVEEYPTQALNKIMKSAGSRVATALYQQRPTTEGGGLVKTKWFKFWQAPPSYSHKLLSVDAAFKGNETSDYVVFQAWGVMGSKHYLLDQVREKMGFTETVSALDKFCQKHHDYHQLIIEEKANGAAIIDVLKNKLRSIIPINPKDSKIARVNAVAPQIEAGDIVIPDPSLYAWVRDYLTEWEYFPNGMHDDQIDTTSQVLLRLRDNPVGALVEDTVTHSSFVSPLGSDEW